MARKKVNVYELNGVKIAPCTLRVGKEIKLSYCGLLAKSGAREVYARIGYGDQFDNVSDWKMTRVKSGFEVVFPIQQNENINVCFRDGLNNWDNNSGNNYSFSICKTPKKVKSE